MNSDESKHYFSKKQALNLNTNGEIILFIHMGSMTLTIDELKQRVLDSETAIRTLGDKIDSIQNTYTEFDESVRKFTKLQTDFTLLTAGLQKNIINLPDLSHQYSDIIAHMQSMQTQIENTRQNYLLIAHSIENVSTLKSQINQIARSVTQLEEEMKHQFDTAVYYEQTDEKNRFLHQHLIALSDRIDRFIDIIVILFVIGIVGILIVTYF